MPAPPTEYVPRQPEGSVLHEVVREHLESFLAQAAERSVDGRSTPAFVEKELRAFLRCGVLAAGFARLRCGGCGHDRLVAFSCKGRGFCPSCGGRRMTELSTHLVDEVLPIVPVRQWVLSLPHRLRYLVAWNHELARAVLAVFARALQALYRDRARRRRLDGGRTGAVTFIQRFGGALNVNPHFHTLCLDGVFTETPDGELRFHRAPPLTGAEVAKLLETVHRRVVRLLERRGLLLGDGDESDGTDSLFDISPALASCYSASISYTSAMGERAGRPLRRLGAAGVFAKTPDNDVTLGPRRARFDGFDLHADVLVPARDRARLERLCRYTARPAVSQERLERSPDGTVVLVLKAPWSDGTEQILFEPVELIEKLASLVPRPRINLVIYHGVLAANAKWRKCVVRYGRELVAPPGKASSAPHCGTAKAPTPGRDEPSAAGNTATGPPAARRRRLRWADLMRRAFGIDVLECPRCGGKLILLACITHRPVIRAILHSVGLSSDIPTPAPARASPADAESSWPCDPIEDDDDPGFGFGA